MLGSIVQTNFLFSPSIKEQTSTSSSSSKEGHFLPNSLETGFNSDITIYDQLNSNESDFPQFTVTQNNHEDIQPEVNALNEENTTGENHTQESPIIVEESKFGDVTIIINSVNFDSERGADDQESSIPSPRSCDSIAAESESLFFMSKKI